MRGSSSCFNSFCRDAFVSPKTRADAFLEKLSEQIAQSQGSAKLRTGGALSRRLCRQGGLSHSSDRPRRTELAEGERGAAAHLRIGTPKDQDVPGVRNGRSRQRLGPRAKPDEQHRGREKKNN